MWTPSLPESPEPIYRRLIAALAQDIDCGALAPGERLPAQRALAHAIGVGLGAVTRAYAEAAQRGLLVGEVGRGSFVARAQRAEPPGPVDLSRNLPPLAPAARIISETFARLARRRELVDALAYAPPCGAEGARRAFARWLAEAANWPEPDPDRIVVTAGAQQGMAVALAAACRPGDAVIAEEATFHGLKLIAAQVGYRLIPAAMDAEGLDPDALDRAAAQSGARVAYVLPVQNPTARVMGAARRRAILDVARRRGLTIVEDDLYAPYAAPLGLPPLAAFDPDRVWHVTGLSKTLAPGLRVGCVIAPRGQEAAAEAALRAIAFGPPCLGPLVATDWIESGAAAEILAAVKAELAARCALARDILGAAVAPTPMAASPHLWLPMDELEAERVSGRALRAGVRTTPPRALALDGAPVRGLRLCLGPPTDRAALEQALIALKGAFARDGADSLQVV